MKVITNERLIKRNSRIGQIILFSGFFILIAGMVINIRNPNLAAYSWWSLILGLVTWQIGMYFTNRWGRRPRPDKVIDQGLKGLNDQYSIYHYVAPVAHLLVGPSGLWVIRPYYLAGNIVYEKNRWKQKGGGVRQTYMKIFGQDGIGRPDIEVPADISSVDKFFKKNIPDTEILEPKAVLVFVNDKAELEIDNAPIPTILIKELKSTIRKSAKEKPLSPEMIKQINALFA